MLTLSTDQKTVLTNLIDWFKDKKKSQSITLGGYAGTGKTTLISVFRKRLLKENKKLKVAFVSFTGKATRVLHSKLKETGAIYKNDNVSTIHSLIYSPIVNDKEEIIGWEKKESIKFDLIILDEASMVDRNIWNDLLSYNIPIVAVGDHGQLPPIRGSFNLMEEPILRLEEIHRQAKDNPIIKVSILARRDGYIPARTYAPRVKKLSRQDGDGACELDELLDSFDPSTYILCGYNSTRVKLNSSVRQRKEIESINPVVGDRVICLRNNHITKVYNGMLGTILTIDRDDDSWFYAKIEIDDGEIFKGLISLKQFGNENSLNFTSKRGEIMKGDLFDFGYAMTVHKAQGGQAKRVILFEERFRQMDDLMWRRWLYTGVTRAEEELYVVGR
jgi:exodeoxyribonuclease-5